MDDYRERIAAVQHEIWSHWMRYLFSVCGELNDDGSATIPAYNVERWHRQMATGYADLTDKERESDRNQADKVLAERDAEIKRLRAQCDNLFNQLRAAEKFAAALAGDAAELRAQVAELEAWKAAVPVATLRVYVDKTNRIKNEMYSRQYLYEDFLTDRYVIDQWLATFDAMAPD